jgi:hypothetical protein
MRQIVPIGCADDVHRFASDLTAASSGLSPTGLVWRLDASTNLRVIVNRQRLQN